MDTITVFFKDGTAKKFEHKPRPGGSYSLSGRFENGWFVVVDEWGNKTAFPSELVAEVKTTARRSW